MKGQLLAVLTMVAICFSALWVLAWMIPKPEPLTCLQYVEWMESLARNRFNDLSPRDQQLVIVNIDVMKAQCRALPTP